MPEKRKQKPKIVAENRQARYHYELGAHFEAGIVLKGSEVKSLRTGKAMIAESYATVEQGEARLINATIPDYVEAGRFNHEPKRLRTLLLHAKEIKTIRGALERDGMTLVPLKLYFNEHGRAKLELALAKGKKLHDKRETERARDWGREKARLMRAKG